MEMNEIHQLLLCADGIKLLGRNTVTITNTTGDPSDASKKAGH
jgi:hypothetical protein